MKMTIEYDFTLADLRKEGATFQEIAEMLGVTKDAVRQMEVKGREIFLAQIGKKWHYSEWKPWRREPNPLGALGSPPNPNPKLARSRRLRSEKRTAS